jgi:hypothetical protein
MNQTNLIRVSTVLTVLTFPFWLTGYILGSLWQLIKINVISVTTLTRTLVVLPNSVILSFAQIISKSCTKKGTSDEL